MNPPFRYLGRRNNASTHKGTTDCTVHAIIEKLLIYEDAFTPTNCSVERLVNTIENPITVALNPLPAKKYP